MLQLSAALRRLMWRYTPTAKSTTKTTQPTVTPAITPTPALLDDESAELNPRDTGANDGVVMGTNVGTLDGMEVGLGDTTG